MNKTVRAILTFWFGDPTDPGSEYGYQRRCWFRKDPAFDETIRQRFLTDYEQAAAGEWDDWQSDRYSCLALILLLDQFPRNLFRGDRRGYATDDQALATAHYAIAQKYDQTLLAVERMFIYLPFEHSENMADQAISINLFEQLSSQLPGFESTLDYAYRHREVIAHFGRFPHRNQILGRTSTASELEFLQQPGSRF